MSTLVRRAFEKLVIRPEGVRHPLSIQETTDEELEERIKRANEKIRREFAKASTNDYQTFWNEHFEPRNPVKRTTR